MDRFLTKPKKNHHQDKTGNEEENSRKRTETEHDQDSTNDQGKEGPVVKQQKIKEGPKAVYTALPSDITGETKQCPILANYPEDEDGRHFNADWYKRFEWLEYSVERNAAFCYACRHFAKVEKGKAFTVVGYKGWKRAVGDKKKGLLQHDEAPVHKAAMVDWAKKMRNLETGSSVTHMLCNEVFEHRRYYIKSIADMIQFLAINELPFRGDYDDEEGCEKGLFTSLFQYTLKKDEKLASIVHEIPKNATYTSPEIQNDVINIMATMVTKSVADDVKSADVPFFTVFADGTRDKSNTEHVSVAVRYVREGKPKESLLKIVTTSNLDAQSLSKVILDALTDEKINIQNMISQCYDGASCMSGVNGGVQRIIQNELGKEIPYVHCFNHRLHLVVVDLVSTLPELQQFFDQIGMLYKFFRKMRVDSKYEGTSIKRVLDTRWSGHLSATRAIVDNAVAIQDALAAVKTSSSSTGEEMIMATGLATTIATNEFRFFAVMMNFLLGMLEPVDKSLQSRETDLNEAMVLIDIIVEQLQTNRSEIKFQELLNEAKNMLPVQSSVEDNGDEHNARSKRKRTLNSRLAEFVVTEPIGQVELEASVSPENKMKTMLYEAIDTILSELQRRFTGNGWLYASVKCLSRKSAKFLDAKSLSPLKKLGIKLPTEQELQLCKNLIDKTVAEGDPQEFCSILKHLYAHKLGLQLSYELFAAVATLGSSTAICESSFSTLTRIDTAQRRSMTDLRQQNLALLAFEKRRTAEIDMQQFITNFAKEHTRLSGLQV
jgi:hypothetical protein